MPAIWQHKSTPIANPGVLIRYPLGLPLKPPTRILLLTQIHVKVTRIFFFSIVVLYRDLIIATEKIDIDDSTLRSRAPNYRPWVMRTWALCLWCIMPLISIAVLEYFHQTFLRDRDRGSSSGYGFIRTMASRFAPLILVIYIFIFPGYFLVPLDRTVKDMEPFFPDVTAWGCEGLGKPLRRLFQFIIYHSIHRDKKSSLDNSLHIYGPDNRYDGSCTAASPDHRV